jgi:hypothetical protein
MPIIFDEVTAAITPPAPTASATESRDSSAAAPLDPQALVRELQRIAERAERLNAD